jgi:hypothetical protein
MANCSLLAFCIGLPALNFPVDNSMHKTLKQKLALAFFLCTTLLGVQLATLTHAIDHSFHEHIDLCDTFIAFEHSASVTTSVMAMFAKPVLAAPFPVIHVTPIKQTISSSLIRAPPFASSLF